ncbi:Magnesium transporter NIPA [Giardia muris]|uniref:Magnesium transporter NIPA n=1 Tax=Giardia muris TaxID=5742 RepID=A0A4Z1SLJ8_GIAMU|nr:Magnesium transporter NIPA [Giardia muris]|eukprot:TNJ26400.1 Magnesium transporter NIPA [Giardia muris]
MFPTLHSDTSLDGTSILFWIGCFIVLASTTCQNVGMFLQKRAHLRQQRLERTDSPRYWRNWAWWCATLVFVLGVVLDFVSLSLLPTVITLPLGSIGLVISLLCSHFGLRERIFWSDIVGMILIMAGACLTVVFATKSRDLLTIPTIRVMLHPTDVPLWYFLSFFVLAPLVVGLSFLVPSALTFGICPGTLGVITMMTGKIVGELTLQTFFYNSNQMRYLEYYAFILCLVAAVLCQNHLLQRALAFYDNTIIVPVYYVTLTLFNCLTGLLFFRDFTDVQVGQGVAFGIGIFIVCAGCAFLSVAHLKNPRRLETFQSRFNLLEEGVFYDVAKLQTTYLVDSIEEVELRPQQAVGCRKRLHPSIPHSPSPCRREEKTCTYTHTRAHATSPSPQERP